jgi:predicted DNA-binding WGR domain protein
MFVKVSNAENNEFSEVKLTGGGSVTNRWGQGGTEGQSSVKYTGASASAAQYSA